MMETYEVTIQATITKTITLKASTEDEATEQAHESFSVLNDEYHEHYDEQTLSVKQVP